jgi:hypothetical protein
MLSNRACSISSQKDHSFKGIDAWGLYKLDIKTTKKIYEANFSGESIIISEKDSDTIEMVIKISEILIATVNRTDLVPEIIRTPKQRKNE